MIQAAETRLNWHRIIPCHAESVAGEIQGGFNAYKRSDLWSFMKDECIVKYYPEGTYQEPERITTTLHDTLMIAQYYYECGLYVQFTMSLCIEWLFLFVRDDPRYSPPQQKSWYTKNVEECPEITAMLESEQRSEIIGTLRRMPQNFLFKGLPDDIKDDYKLMDF